MFVTLGAVSFGVLLGVRHACEPDHLAALSTLASEDAGPRRGAWLGAIWGLGHTLALLAVAVVLALAQAQLPAALADAFELGVSLMLIGLGVRALRRSARRVEPDHAHRHPSLAPHVHVGRWTFARRSLAVGLVHGLAGSGALTALVLARLPSVTARLAYIALFGVGSALGMAALSGAAGWPLERLGRSPRAARTLGLASGAFSTVFGLAWAWPPCARLLG